MLHYNDILNQYLNWYIKKCSAQYTQKERFFRDANNQYMACIEKADVLIQKSYCNWIKYRKEEKLTPAEIATRFSVARPIFLRISDEFKEHGIKNAEDATALRKELDKGDFLEVHRKYNQADALLKLRRQCMLGYLLPSDLFGDNGIMQLFQNEIEYDEKEHIFSSINDLDKAHLNPLHYACILGHYELAAYCIKHKADKFALAGDADTKYSTLHLIAQNRHPTTANILNLLCLDKDGDLEDRAVKELENKDAKGRTPLETAAYCGNLEVVKWLLDKIENNEDLQKMKTVGERTKMALHCAIFSGHKEIVQELLKYFCKERLNKSNNKMEGGNYTKDLKFRFSNDVQDVLPLYRVFLHGHADMVPIFLDHGISLSNEERRQLIAIAANDPILKENLKRCVMAERAHKAKEDAEMESSTASCCVAYFCGEAGA